MPTCRAWVLAGPDQLNVGSFLVDQSTPLLRVDAVGLCGTDVHALRGRLPVSYPLVLGHEIVGSLVDPAQRTPRHSGQRFVLAPTMACQHCEDCIAGVPTHCSARRTYGLNLGSSSTPLCLCGGFSDFVAVLPGFQLIPVPASLPTEIAVLTEPLACCLSALRRAAAVWPLPGAKLAVIGAGPIGLLTAVTAELLGAKVTVIERVVGRQRLAANLGLEVIDPGNAIVLEEQMDHIVDCAGTAAAVNDAVRLAHRGGVIVIFGSFSAMAAMELAPSLICNRELSILGASTTYAPDYAIALRLLSWHMDRFSPIVSHRVPLFGADSLLPLFEMMERGECSKICLLPESGG